MALDWSFHCDIYFLSQNIFSPSHYLSGIPSITEDNGCHIFRQVWLPSLCSSYQDNSFISHGLSLKIYLGSNVQANSGKLEIVTYCMVISIDNQSSQGSFSNNNVSKWTKVVGEDVKSLKTKMCWILYININRTHLWFCECWACKATTVWQIYVANMDNYVCVPSKVVGPGHFEHSRLELFWGVMAYIYIYI